MQQRDDFSGNGNISKLRESHILFILLFVRYFQDKLLHLQTNDEILMKYH